MNRETLQTVGIDMDTGIQKFDGNIQLYEKFLYGFLSDPNYIIMLDAINKGDSSSALHAAHALKNIADNLSLMDLHKNIGPLVETFKRNELENVNELLAPVKSTYEAIFNVLND